MLKRRFWMVRAAVVAICAALAGRAAAHLVEGAWLIPVENAPARTAHAPDPPPRPREKPSRLARDLFCSGCTPPGPRPRDPARPATRSALPVELVSTMYCPRDEAWSMAVIRDLSTKEKDAHLYGRGARLHDATIVRVLDKRVYLKRDNDYEYLEFPDNAIISQPEKQATKSVACGPNGCQVERALVEKLLADPSALGRVAPAPGGGFRLFAISPNSVLARLGLQNGDILKSINGTELTTPEVVFELYLKLRHASHLAVAIERRGQRSTLDYSVVK